MKIMEYDQVDPLSVLHLTWLALDFWLTPEHASHIRRTDPRPFPFFTVNAVEHGEVLGQVGVFRLPMVTIEGKEDVGGVWAVCTHPQHTGRGIASLLLEEAHNRMREAGLRFSTLWTNRFRTAYHLYQKHGYEDMNAWATAFAPWEVAHQPTRLRAEPADLGGFDLADQVFADIASQYLGFAWRYTPFTHFRERIKLEDIQFLWKNDQPVGYALTSVNQSILSITNLLLRCGEKPAEAVAAVVSRLKIAYVQVRVSRPVEFASLRQAGFKLAHPDWNAFMLKPLVPEMTVEDARRLFAIGTDRFLISWLDTT
jgi:GNAT superfamily N-acetyltransferase